MDSLNVYRKALEQSVVKVEGGRPGTAINQSIQKRLKPQYSEVLSLPERTIAPIQDIDPESETFGQFFFMPDVDPVDGPTPIL